MPSGLSFRLGRGNRIMTHEPYPLYSVVKVLIPTKDVFTNYSDDIPIEEWPANATGTIVMLFPSGYHYAIEMTDPSGVVDVHHDDLELLWRGNT